MKENIRNKETYTFRKPQGFRAVCMYLTAEAVGWLDGTTKDDDDNMVSNRILFYDLLARMWLLPGRDDSFRRAQSLQAGQFQFSEISLAEEWNMGRKKIHNLLTTMGRLDMITVCNSRVASIAAVTCIEGWIDSGGNRVRNPFCRFHQLSDNI
jgi:hypothetical protein